jgi:hypothetical protein
VPVVSQMLTHLGVDRSFDHGFGHMFEQAVLAY